MLVTLITNHVQQALGRLLQQYKTLATPYNIPLTATAPTTTLPTSAAIAPLIAFVDQIQALENAIFALDEGRQLFNGTIYPAVGAQLDGIGQIVGIARNGLSDAEYLIFILGTIAENNSDSTVGAVVNIASLLFQVPSVVAFPLFPAEFDIQVTDATPLQPFLFSVVVNILASSLGAGIGLGFVSLYPAAGGFRFGRVGDPLDFSHGFGDTAHPGSGGGFAGNIFSNVGA